MFGPNFCCFWVDGTVLEARLLSTARTEAGLGGPRSPGSTAVFSAPHLERRAGGRGPERGSHTYYGHLGDEDPPNGISHPAGGKSGSVSAPEATAPQEARAPGRPPLPSAALRQVRVLDNELDVLFGEFRDPHRGLVGVRHRDLLPASRAGHKADLRVHQQFVCGDPGASG